jgi:hypothetical protein
MVVIMARRQSNPTANRLTPRSFKKTIKKIVVGVIVAIIAAWLLQEGIFAVQKDNSSAVSTPYEVSTLLPNSTQIIDDSTLNATVNELSTVRVFDGDLIISVDRVEYMNVYGTFGSIKCAEQAFGRGKVGEKFIYKCDGTYDIRISSIQDGASINHEQVEFLVTKLQ